MGTGRRDCFLSLSCFFKTNRELKAKRGGVLGREGGQPFASFFLLFFPFSLFFSVQCFSTKRNETKRNEMKLCGSYSSFMNDLEMSPKKENQIIFI